MRLFFFALILGFVTVGYAEFEKPEFPLLTLEAFEKLPGTRDVADSKADFNIDAARPGLQAVLTYTGEERPIPKDMIKLIDIAGKSIGIPDFAGNFPLQIKVTEGKLARWINVQKTHAPYFPKELKPGQKFKAQMRLAGSAKRELAYLLINYVAIAGK